jgi:alkylation response protein AidB-like acyl-CoA dehydrogenase
MYSLNTQQKRLQEKARRLATEVISPRAKQHDIDQEYPWDNVKDLSDMGFMGMTIPKEYGGQGLNYLDTVIVVEEIAKACGVTGRIVVEGNMGAISTVMKYGNDKQKKMAAKYVLKGDKPAICITEPNAGSAATQMTTRADKKGDKYILNGIKHWITGGGVSKFHLIFARVFDENGEELGIGSFIAISGEQGLTVGKREPTMGLRSIPETEIIIQDMELSADRLIQPPKGLARGFAGLMNAYNSQRVGAGTVALGIAQGAYDLALDYIQEREQFSRPICEFQGLQWMLVDMSIKLEASRALIYKAAGNAGTGFPDIIEAAQAKIYASESSIQVTSDALQMFGAKGYSRDNPLERMYRDVRMFTIGGGTAQILRTVTASQLLKRKLPQTRNGYQTH